MAPSFQAFSAFSAFSPILLTRQKNVNTDTRQVKFSFSNYTFFSEPLVILIIVCLALFLIIFYTLSTALTYSFSHFYMKSYTYWYTNVNSDTHQCIFSISHHQCRGEYLGTHDIDCSTILYIILNLTPELVKSYLPFLQFLKTLIYKKLFLQHQCNNIILSHHSVLLATPPHIFFSSTKNVILLL